MACCPRTCGKCSRTMLHEAVADALSMYKSYGRRGADKIMLVIADSLPSGGRSSYSKQCPNCAATALKKARSSGVKVAFLSRTQLHRAIPISAVTIPVIIIPVITISVITISVMTTWAIIISAITTSAIAISAITAV